MFVTVTNTSALDDLAGVPVSDVRTDLSQTYQLVLFLRTIDSYNLGTQTLSMSYCLMTYCVLIAVSDVKYDRFVLYIIIAITPIHAWAHAFDM